MSCAATGRALAGLLRFPAADPRVRELHDLEQVDDVDRESEGRDRDPEDRDRPAEMPMAAFSERHEARRERGGGEGRAPRPHRQRRPPLREADVHETVMEVATVCRIDGNAV